MLVYIDFFKKKKTGKMKAITVDTAASPPTVTVQAGANLVEVNGALWAHKLAIPTGTCPTVGIAGFTLGGGHGLLLRKRGEHAEDVPLDGLLRQRGEHADFGRD